MSSINNSSKPFRAFPVSVLSVTKHIPVAASTFNPDMALDTIVEHENQDTGALSENNIDDDSGTIVKGLYLILPRPYAP